MKKESVRLICKGVRYYARIDEDLFFAWIKSIPSIVRLDGQLDELYLYFKSKRIPYKDLLELTGLFYRYKIANMEQLQIFVNKSNRKMYAEGPPYGYWHKRVFGTKTNKKS